MDQFMYILELIDKYIWGIPLCALIIGCGIWLTLRVRFLQIRHLGRALKYMVHNEAHGEGEVTSFGALCTALSATHRHRQHRGRSYGHRRRWTGRAFMDGNCRFFRYGHQIFRRPSGHQIPQH